MTAFKSCYLDRILFAFTLYFAISGPAFADGFNSGPGVDVPIGAGGTVALTICSGGPASTSLSPACAGDAGHLVVANSLQVNPDATACTTALAGSIRFNPTTQGFEGCTGTGAWVPFAASGTTAYFSFQTCSAGGNGNQCNSTVPLATYVPSLPTDTNYQIICTMEDIPAYSTGGSPSGFITLVSKTTASFEYIFSVYYDDQNHGDVVPHIADCVYHHP